MPSPALSLPQKEQKPKCIECLCLISPGDGSKNGMCRECQIQVAARSKSKTIAPIAKSLPRAFTAIDKALIKRMSGYIPPEQLLGILNDRLHVDLGSSGISYSMEQLRMELQQQAGNSTATGDWAGLRRIVAEARRSGLLDAITRQMIDDFALVFSASPAQVTRMKDVILESGRNDKVGVR